MNSDGTDGDGNSVAFKSTAPVWQIDREYAENKHYNLDLLDQISRHPHLRDVEVKTGLLDHGAGNSTSAIAWRYAG